jgi:hypothetical protein
LIKARFWTDSTKKLLSSQKLLPTLQQVFDDFFKEHCDIDDKKSIGTYLSNENNRPTLKHYLDAFARAGENIQDKNVRDALVKDTKKDWKKVQWVQSLDKSIANLTHFSLLEEGILAREEKTALVASFDNSFSHTEITTWIFKDLPRSRYILEKNQFMVYTDVYDKKIRGAKSEQEANQRRKLYEKKLLEGYLDRANEQIKKQWATTPKAELIAQLTTISKLQEPGFSKQKNNLISSISTYLQEDYLESQIDHDMIKAQCKEFGIEEKYFDNYLKFWKQIYDLNNKEAKLSIGDKTFSLYADKQLITHPDKFTSVDNLDRLFSFERTIDFKKSDPIFSTLFWNTPQAYIVDDKNWGILDTINYEYDIPVYLDTPKLTNRVLLDQKSEIEVTDIATWNTYTWFPQLDEEQDMIDLIDKEGKKIFTLPFETQESENTDPVGIINSEKYSLEATKRTFSQPATPPIVTQLIQTAVFNEMAPDNKKIPTKKVEEQADILDDTTPIRPHFATYTTDTEEEADDDGTDLEKQLKQEKIGSYRFASTVQMPDEVKKDIAGRVPPKPLHEVRAWIDQGEVFFHSDYFYKKYHLANISHEEKIIDWEPKQILTFTLASGVTINIHQLSELKRHPDILACIAELRSAKVHEVAHRLLHFHDITSVPYTTEEGAHLDINQETLCEIADRQSLPRQFDKASQRCFVLIAQHGKQHQVRLDTLEATVGETIEWFTRWSIRRLDAKQLEAYEADYEKFADLVVANTLTPATERSVKTGNKAMKNKLDKFIKKLEEQYDPGNQAHIEQTEHAEQHLETLRQQLTALNAGTVLSQEELNEMREAQIQANSFLQEHLPAIAPSRNQQTANESRQPRNPRWNEPTWTEQERAPSHQAIQEEERDFENDREEFEKWFDLFKGDSSAKLQHGTVLFLKDTTSHLPWAWFNRVKYKITDLTDKNITFEMSDATEKNVAKKSTVRKPLNKETLQMLKKVGKNDIYKYQESRATKSWFMQSVGTNLGWKRAEVKNFKKTIQENNKTKQEEVTHVGVLSEKVLSSESSESVVYKVDRWVNTVTVQAAVPAGDKSNEKKKALRTKKMDYDTFQMFCFSKDLGPLTSSEVIRTGQRLDPKKIASDGLPRQGISLAAIRKGLKAIPETYKKKFEEEQEFQTALATDWLSNIIPNTSFLYLDEIKNDLWWTDGLVRQRIQKFKSERAATGDSDKASVHDKAIYENIEANVFNKIKPTRKFKYKAAGALLYTLEKWWAYARALASYANKDGWGWWVKCILGERARQQFITERQRRIDLFKSKWWTHEELQSEIVKYELQFLQDATSDKPGRWTKFWREIEGHKDTLYGWANSIDPSGFSKKGDFPYMLDAFWNWGIGQNIPWTMMSALEAMKWAVENGKHYNEFYMSILALFATGAVHMFPQDYISKLKAIGRSRGIPIALLAGDAHASGKVMHILDHIARNAGVTTFSEFTGKDLSIFDAMHIHNYDIEDRKATRDSFKNRRSNYGSIMIDAFNYDNDFLVDIPETETKTTRIVTNYLWPEWVFGDYKDVQNRESIDAIDGQSPFFEKWLLNLSEGAFKGYMMKFTQWELSNDHSITLWHGLAQKLQQFENNINSGGNTKANYVKTKLLYQKFVKFFDTQLAGSSDEPEWKWQAYKALFNQAVQGKVPMDKLIKKSIFKQRERTNQEGDALYMMHETIRSDLVKDTIMQFANLIKNSYSSLDGASNQDSIFDE